MTNSLVTTGSGSAPSSGSGIGGSGISVDWSAKARDRDAQVKTDRRSAVVKARAAVEAGWTRPTGMTKSERLRAAASKGHRDVASPAERRSTLSSIQKAAESVRNAASDADITLSRATRNELRARHGSDLGAFVKRAEAMDKALANDHDGSAAAEIMKTYLYRTKENFKDAEPLDESRSVRSSIRRATQDAADARSLAGAEQSYGKALPAILEQLERHDRALIEDPSSILRLSLAYGNVPVTAADMRAHEAKQAAEAQQQVAYRQEFANVEKAIHLIAEHNVLPHMRDEAFLETLAQVLSHPAMNPHKAKYGNDRMALLQHAHHVACQVHGHAAAPSRSNAGSKSIGGGSPGHAQAARGQNTVRAALAAAQERI